MIGWLASYVNPSTYEKAPFFLRMFFLFAFPFTIRAAGPAGFFLPDSVQEMTMNMGP